MIDVKGLRGEVFSTKLAKHNITIDKGREDGDLYYRFTVTLMGKAWFQRRTDAQVRGDIERLAPGLPADMLIRRLYTEAWQQLGNKGVVPHVWEHRRSLGDEMRLLMKRYVRGAGVKVTQTAVCVNIPGGQGFNFQLAELQELVFFYGVGILLSPANAVWLRAERGKK